jgi:hypothetical protein
MAPFWKDIGPPQTTEPAAVLTLDFPPSRTVRKFFYKLPSLWYCYSNTELRYYLYKVVKEAK